MLRAFIWKCATPRIGGTFGAISGPPSIIRGRRFPRSATLRMWPRPSSRVRLLSCTTPATTRLHPVARRPCWQSPAPTWLPAGAFSHRISVAAEPADGATAGASVREINLDVPNRATKDDLAKSINKTDWPSGTRFLVHGTKRKLCSPIRVSNRSFTIEFLDKELVLAFDDRRVEASSDREAFITVTGGSIEIVNATIRIESSTRPSTHRLLDVRGGNFTIRGSNLSGPRHENPGYEELIRFSSSVDESIAPTEGDQFVGLVRNSFLSSIRNLISGDLSSRHLVFENSLLVAENRIFDLRLPAGPGPSGLDLRSCTLSAGTEYFHFNTRTTAGTLNRAHVFVENSVFAPPVRPTKGGSMRATLFGSASGDLLKERVDWWEYGNAYSDLIELPGRGSSRGAPDLAGADPLGGWRDLAGPAHIIRSVGQPGAVSASGRHVDGQRGQPGRLPS